MRCRRRGPMPAGQHREPMLDWNGLFIRGDTSDYNGQTVHGLLLLASHLIM